MNGIARSTLVLGLLFGSAAAHAESLTPLSVRYDVAWSGFSLGDGSLTLTASGNDCYHYVLATNPIGIVRWTYGSPKETSDFCVQNGAVVAKTMNFNNPKRSKDGFTLLFDWAKGKVSGGRYGSLAVPAGTVDRLSVQQAARLWVKTHVGDAKPGNWAVNVVDHKRLKRYTFALKGSGEVQTPKGAVKAIRFERIDDPNTTLRFWLSPEKDYMPVSVENVEDGETKLRLVAK